MQKHRAFTLIELLIVVAIIAILAAIAVPNFLEAQVRSKVSRQVTNMRSLATALEAYAIDENKYPLTTVAPFFANYTSGTPQEMYKMIPGSLTTPIAYISGDDAKQDIFRFAHNFPQYLANQVMWLPSLIYDPTDVYQQGNASVATYAAQRARYGEWVMRSAGPDTYYQNVLADKVDYGQGPGGWNRAAYDPTNGTVSGGDIYRSQKRPDETHALK